MASKFGACLLSFLLSMQFIPWVVWGHGEDKLGPHGGHIQMPGAFHTELVMKSKKELSVFLLDMDWANPTIESSSVRCVFKSGKRESPLICEIEQDHFRCVAPKGISVVPPGKIEIIANRKGISGSPAEYKLPLIVLR